jgi:hypothetical protein
MLIPSALGILQHVSLHRAVAYLFGKGRPLWVHGLTRNNSEKNRNDKMKAVYYEKLECKGKVVPVLNKHYAMKTYW